MKTLLHLGLLCALCTLFTFNTSFAQVRLDVEGDAKIRGKMDISDGQGGILLGIDAGGNNSIGANNIFIGQTAGKFNTSGANNIFIGRGVGENNNNGNANTFMGVGAGFSNISGVRNTYIGNNAGRNNPIGFNNTYIGLNAGISVLKTTQSTFIGANSGQTNPADSLDLAIAIGENAKVNCSNCAVIGGSGSDAVNVGIGTDTPEAELHVVGTNKTVGNINIIKSAGDSSVFIGANSGIMDDGTDNQQTFVGTNAGKNTTSGGFNTFIGYDAGLTNTSGSSNAYVGYQSGWNNTSGFRNAFLGYRAGFFNTSGQDNTFLGYQTGFNNTTGNFNTYVGYQAGLGVTNDTRNTFIGYRADQTNPADSLDKAIAIGFFSRVNCSNCAVIGGTGSNAVNVGIGTDTPEAKLHVTGSVRFDDLPDGSGTTLQVDGDGNLVLAVAANNINNRVDQLEAENEDLRARLEKMEQLLESLSNQSETRTTQNAIITRATLQQNVPNPFTEATNIDYFIPEGTKQASLQVMDQNGRMIKSIPIQARGEGQITLQANLLSAGTYSYSLILDGQVMETKQMVLTH